MHTISKPKFQIFDPVIIKDPNSIHYQRRAFVTDIEYYEEDYYYTLDFNFYYKYKVCIREDDLNHIDD